VSPPAAPQRCGWLGVRSHDRAAFGLPPCALPPCSLLAIATAAEDELLLAQAKGTTTSLTTKQKLALRRKLKYELYTFLLFVVVCTTHHAPPAPHHSRTASLAFEGDSPPDCALTAPHLPCTLLDAVARHLPRCGQFFIWAMYARRTVKEAFRLQEAISTAFTEENFGDYNEKTFLDIATPAELFDWMEGPLQQGLFPERVRTHQPHAHTCDTGAARSAALERASSQRGHAHTTATATATHTPRTVMQRGWRGWPRLHAAVRAPTRTPTHRIMGGRCARARRGRHLSTCGARACCDALPSCTTTN
jgi:hypothetical protein